MVVLCVDVDFGGVTCAADCASTGWAANRHAAKAAVVT